MNHSSNTKYFGKYRGVVINNLTAGGGSGTVKVNTSASGNSSSLGTGTLTFGLSGGVLLADGGPCSFNNVVVLTSGSAVAASSAAEHAAALVAAWYGGEEAGTAIAETLAGVNNPAGRLPVKFYRSVDQLPPFTDYAMKGRTYRCFKGEPLYPFGFGLSYTSFGYSDLKAETPVVPPDGDVRLSFTVRNTGNREGKDEPQVYLRDDISSGATPMMKLAGFTKIELAPGESRRVTMTIPSRELALWDRQMRRVVEPGAFTVLVGSSAETICLMWFLTASLAISSPPVRLMAELKKNLSS